jgi:hypothetical protein
MHTQSTKYIETQNTHKQNINNQTNNQTTSKTNNKIADIQRQKQNQQ